MATLHLVRGYPGSGKSTFVKRTFPGVFHVENDMYLIQDGFYNWSKERVKHAVKWASLMVKTALVHDFDVVVSNTFTKRRYVDFYKNIAETYSAKLKVYRCVGDFQNVHGLSNDMVKKFKNAMEDYPDEVIVEHT